MRFVLVEKRSKKNRSEEKRPDIRMLLFQFIAIGSKAKRFYGEAGELNFEIHFSIAQPIIK